jgi:hypothetical protein
MRTDIYSYTNQNGKFLVELHTSSLKARNLGDTFKGESIQQVRDIIDRLIKNDSTFGKDGFQRVVIDSNWKKVQIVGSKGNTVTHTISKLINPPTEEDAEAKNEAEKKEETSKSVELTTAPMLLASTDKVSNLYMKGGYVERSFRPITPLEKIWKFLTNISLFIRGAAAKQGMTLGSYDFAVHFFSKEATRKELQTSELRTSTMLNRLCDFFNEHEIGTTDDRGSILRASAWAKKIEDLRHQNQSTIQKEYEKIARNIDHEVGKLGIDGSILIPFSSYEGEQGQIVESLRLLRLTRTKDAQDNSKLFKIEFIDDKENPPLVNITEKSLNLDDFFKPLIDIQLPASFYEEASIDGGDPGEKIERLKNRFYNFLYRFAKNHPRLTSWILIGKSPIEQQRLVAGIITHAKSIGVMPPHAISVRTNLKPEELISSVFGPLMSVDSLNQNSAMFVQKHSMLSTSRMIDNFLPLIKPEEQAKVEAKSLFHFYYLYEKCLGEDPASMTILEDGVKRVSELYGKLEIPDLETNEMLFVIRKHLDQVKLKLLKREIDVDQKVKTPSLPERFFTSIPGKAFNNNDTIGKLRGEKSFEFLPKLTFGAGHKELAAQEGTDRINLSKIETLEESIADLSSRVDLMKELATNNRKTLHVSLKIALANLKHLREPIDNPLLGLSKANAFMNRLETIITSLSGLDPNDDEARDLRNDYETCINELYAALEERKIQLMSELRPQIKEEKEIYKDFLKKQIGIYEKEMSKPGLSSYSVRNYEQNLRTLNSSIESFEDLDKMSDANLRTLFISLIGLGVFIDGSTRRQLSSLRIFLEKNRAIESFARTVQGHRHVLSNYFDKKREIKDASVRWVGQARSAIAVVASPLPARILSILSLDHLAKINVFIGELANTIRELENKSSVQNLKEIPDIADSLSVVLKILSEAKSECLQKIQTPDLNQQLKTIEDRIAVCQKKFPLPLDKIQIRILRSEISAIIELLPLENLDKTHSFWSTQSKWKQNILDLQDLLKIAYISRKNGRDEEHPDYLLYSCICNAIVHRMDWPKLSEFNQRLADVNTKLMECAQTYQKDQRIERLQIIMKMLPAVESGNIKSFWSREWTIKDTNGQTVTSQRMISQLKELIKQNAISDKSAHIRMCDAILKKMEVVYDPEADLLKRSPELLNEFLRFDIPSQQRKFLAIKQTIESYSNYKIIKKDISSSIGIIPKAPKDLNFKPAELPLISQGENTRICPVVLPSVMSQLSARRFFDSQSCNLLENYTTKIVAKETDEGKNFSEESIRLLITHKHGKIAADKFYKLLATNSDEPEIGLEEILYQAASSELLQLLNDKEAKLGIQLRRVIMNRILRADHLKKYFGGPNGADHARAILQQLTGFIETASKKLPLAYSTLTLIKATVLIFIKEHEEKYEESQRKLADIFSTLRDKIGPNDESFKDDKLQLHALRLKIYSSTFSADPKLKLNVENLSDLIDSWCAYNSSATLDYTDKQEEEAIRQFFFGQVLPTWEKLSVEDKNKALTMVLEARGETAPKNEDDEKVSFNWKHEGDVYTTTLGSGKGAPTCQIGLSLGSLSNNGVPVEVTGGSLPHDLWTQFPLFNENYTVTTAKKAENTHPSIVYNFQVKEFDHIPFQVEQLNGKINYSIGLPDDKGVTQWYQHSSLSDPKKTIAENKTAFEANRRRYRSRVINRLLEFIQNLRVIIADLPITKLKAQVKAFGEELGSQMMNPENECSIPKEIMDLGMWIDKKNNGKAIVLDKKANHLVDVKLSTSKKRLKGGVEFNSTLLKSISKPDSKLHLVNNPKSSLYNQLCELSRKENVKMWAEEGVIQEIELTDPKMTFERDETNKLMSKQVLGFFISEDQTIPVADFSPDWKNYLVLRNESGERRLIMRQSSVLSNYFITLTGYERGALVGKEMAKAEGLPVGEIAEAFVANANPPFVEVKIVSHPEKGYSLETHHPQGNFYLALASMQAGNFENAIKYMRLAARSKYNVDQKDLLQALFQYKQHCFAATPQLSHQDLPWQNLAKLSKNMRQFEHLLPSVAAMKLSALAALLEQDLSKEEARLPVAEKINMPDAEQVKKWLAAYHTPDLPNFPWQPVSEGTKLTDDELEIIMDHYPTISGNINDLRLAKAKSELLVPSPITTPIDRAPKILEREILPISKELGSESKLVLRLKAVKQSTSSEKIMTFYAGKYILRHFNEMYKFIDNLQIQDKLDSDGKVIHSAKAERVQLKNIIKQLGRFKDSDPGRSEAVKFLLTLAQGKLLNRVESNWIEIEAARKGLQNHITDLNNHKKNLILNFNALIEVLETGPGKTLDMMSTEEFKQLKQLIKILSHWTFDSPSDEEVNNMSLAQIDAYKKNQVEQLLRLTNEVKTKIKELARKQRLDISGDIPESLVYKTYRPQSLSNVELEEIEAWDNDPSLPIPRCFKKIKLHATYSLADHLREPETFKLPTGMDTPKDVLTELGIFRTIVQRKEWKDKIENAIAQDTGSTSRYKVWLKSNFGLAPLPSERTFWSRQELSIINQSLKEIGNSNDWISKVQTPISFPKFFNDRFDADRLSKFLSSHQDLHHEPYVSKKAKLAVEDIKVEEEPRDLTTMLRSAAITKPFASAEEALDVYKKSKENLEKNEGDTGYFTKLSIPFFDKLSGMELLELDSVIRKKIATNYHSIILAFEVFENPNFHQSPNPFELLKKFLLSTEPIHCPKDIPSACNAILKNISLKSPIGETKLVAEKGKVVLIANGEAILKSPSHFANGTLAEADKNGVDIETMQNVQNAVAAATAAQALVVNEKRQEILKIVSKLPERHAARCAEELRRLRGSSAVIDIEMVFTFFAKDTLSKLVNYNPTLNDADIKAITLLVTQHHIEATAEQTLQKQLECGEKAIGLRRKFEKLSESNASVKKQITDLNGMIPEFLRTVAGEKEVSETQKAHAADSINGLIDKLAKTKDHTLQQLSDDIREYIALLEKSVHFGITKRFYDPKLDHSHTRAALAYEYTLNKVFRKPQIEEFVARVGTPDIVSWLSTGAGKTFMAPGLAKMMATGTNLVTVIDTKDLIPTTSISRDENSRAVYGQAAYNFQFTRDPDRKVESLQQMHYRLLKCIDNEEYIVTTKESLGSLVLQLLTWQRLGSHSTKYDDRIKVAQDIVSLFKNRGVALGDEIHLILNIIEALDYAEGERRPLSEYKEYYETTSTIYRALYPLTGELKTSTLISKEIAELLKIADNQQAQVNKATIQKEAMPKLAKLLIDQSIDDKFKPKDALHNVLSKLMQALRGISLGEEALIDYLTVNEIAEKSKKADNIIKVLQTIKKLPSKEQMRLGALKENLSSSFEMVMKKIAEDDFGVMKRMTDFDGRELGDNLSICPYNKGRPQPSKDFSDIFQTIQTHYMWYLIYGIPLLGLKEKIADWNILIEVELPQYNNDLTQCPAYIEYHSIFGDSAPNIRDIKDQGIADLARKSKEHPEVIFKFLETIVLPQRMVYPEKLGFNSMDLVSMFHKFGGYSGTIQTRPTFHSAVSNKDDPSVDAAAEANFKTVYESPYNQTQYHIPDLDSDVFKKQAQGQKSYVPPFSVQLKAGKINIKEFRAVIDVGGLFKELNFLDMAKDILKQFKPEELEAVLIYNDDSELRILRRGSDRLETFDPFSRPPEYDKRFTVYRQPQFTGADIPQSLHAKALVTINEKTSWGDFEQGVGRLRENKRGQTFVTIYRDSLIEKVKDDIRIAANDKVESEKLQKLLKKTTDGEDLDIKKLTKRAEKTDIKQRRYFAALSEMENIVKKRMLNELSGPNWKIIFSAFEPHFFANSFKNIEQLLEIKMPMKPLEMLRMYKASLLEKIDEAARQINAVDNRATLEALMKTKLELLGYKFPEPQNMPDTVIGTSTSANSQVEVERETHKESENERELEVESITQEEASSIPVSDPETKWKEWELKGIVQLFSRNAAMPTHEGSPIVYKLATDGTELISNLKRSLYRTSKLDVDFGTLFPDTSVTTNMVQHRKKQAESIFSRYGYYRHDKPRDSEFFPHSLFSKGQKSCQSIGEISFEMNGKRRYHHILLDVIDHKVFEESIARAKTILTPDFIESLKAFVNESNGSITIGNILTSVETRTKFLSLFPEEKTSKADLQFLLKLLGDSFTLTELCSLSLRINMNGRVYTNACGALDLDQKDDLLKEKIVRLKILTGETYFSKQERELLMKIMTEDYLKLLDYKAVERELRDKKVEEKEIQRIINAKKALGIKDFSEVSVYDQKILINKVLDLFRLYEKAVHMNLFPEKPKVASKHFGIITKEVLEKFSTYEPTKFY